MGARARVCVAVCVCVYMCASACMRAWEVDVCGKGVKIETTKLNILSK